MDLNVRAIEEMEKRPCVFRKEHYDIELDAHEYICLLTTIRAAEGHSRYSKECDPIKCPIWKGYVMQVMTAKNLSIQL